MKRLFDLSDEILQLERQLENEEITEAERDLLIDKWLEAQGDVSAKIDNYAAWIHDCESRAEHRRFHAARLRTLAMADESRAKRGVERLKAYFERHNIERLQTPRFNLQIQGNGGPRPIHIDIDVRFLRSRYQIISYEANREAIRERLHQIEAETRILEAKLAAKEIDQQTFDQEIKEIHSDLPESVYFGDRGRSLRIL